MSWLNTRGYRNSFQGGGLLLRTVSSISNHLVNAQHPHKRPFFTNSSNFPGTENRFCFPSVVVYSAFGVLFSFWMLHCLEIQPHTLSKHKKLIFRNRNF